MGLFDWLFKPNVKKLEEKKDVEGLISALLYETDWPDVRQEAAEALGRIGNTRAIEPLIRVCGDPFLKDSDSIERSAERALEKFKSDRRARNALVRLSEARRNRQDRWCRRSSDGSYYYIG